MSLKGTSGTSLVEVMVMMVVLGISIVGIYTMVDRGRELAMLTDTRLSAINIAREGLESVTTLRDTFALKGYESGECTIGAENFNAFFSIDNQILLDSNCPEMGTTPPDYDNIDYILGDDKTLIGGNVPPSDYSVCINEFGWYSQELSERVGGVPLNTCRDSPETSGCEECSTTTTLCEATTTQKCQTRFQRKITFRNDADSGCEGTDSGYCVEVTSTVWWGTSPTDTNTSVTLSQIVTTLD